MLFFFFFRKPSREKSGFVAADTVKRGLGPAGAFTGNANWRADAGRLGCRAKVFAAAVAVVVVVIVVDGVVVV